jgi:hypothetical protein
MIARRDVPLAKSQIITIKTKTGAVGTANPGHVFHMPSQTPPSFD